MWPNATLPEAEAEDSKPPNSLGDARRGDLVDDEMCKEALRFLEESAEEEANRAVHAAMASSFATAQRIVAESHERALNVLAKCLEDARKQDKANHDLRTQLASVINSSCLQGTGCFDLEKVAIATERAASKEKRRPARTVERKITRFSVSEDVVKIQDEGMLHPGAIEWKGGTLYTRSKSRTATFLENDSSSANSFCEPPLTSLSFRKRPPSKEPIPPAPSERAPSMRFTGLQLESDHSSADSYCEPLQPSNSGFCSGLPIKTPDDPRSSPPSGHPSPSPSLEGVRTLSHSRSTKTPSEHKTRQRRPSVTSSASRANNQVELLPIWNTDEKKRRKTKKRLNMGKLSRTCSFESLGSVESMMSDDAHGCCWGRCSWRLPVVDPNSVKRACWDSAATLLIFYDMVAIPLLLLSIPSNAFSRTMEWSARLFWTGAWPAGGPTSPHGYLKPDGLVELRSRKIVKSYLKSWFLVDLAIVSSDWMEVIWSDGSLLSVARAGKASRTFRLLRMVRLVRLARVRSLYVQLMERLQSEQLVIVAGIVTIMLVITGLSHVIACAWVGIAMQDRPDTWLRVHGLSDAPLHYKYVTSLHWALLLFAGGTDEVVPQNTEERMFAISTYLLAFVMAAVFVGKLTSSMTQLLMLRRKDVERFAILRRYLLKNEISAVLTLRVMHNAQHALLEAQRFMEESRVELLQIISEPLRIDLHFELYSPVLAVHPFFHCFIDACPQVMKKVCHNAMSQVLVSDGDIVFMPGEVPSPPQLIVVCSGELAYTHLSGAVAYVQAGRWISEAVLWVLWTHQGLLKAAKDCRLCVLDANHFFRLIETFDHDFDVRRYARMFVQCMNDGSLDCSDLASVDECDELLDVIDSLAVRKEEAAGAQEPGNVPLPLGSSQLGDPKESLPKKSVLMVTPACEPKSTGAWW